MYFTSKAENTVTMTTEASSPGLELDRSPAPVTPPPEEQQEDECVSALQLVGGQSRFSF